MKQIPRSRPRNGKYGNRNNNSLHKTSSSNREVFGGAASSGKNSPYRYKKIHSAQAGQSSYKNWKRQKSAKAKFNSKSNHLSRAKEHNIRTKKHTSGKKFLWGKFFKYLLILLLIIFVLLFALGSGFRSNIISSVYSFTYGITHDDPQLTNNDNEQNENAITYKNISVSDNQIHEGNLILVNGNNEYDFDTNADKIDLVSLGAEHHSSYDTLYDDNQVSRIMLNALNDMCDSFYSATGNDSICIISAYRTYEAQDELYNNKVDEVGQEKADVWAAKPGFSEHHTGLAVDIGISSGNGAETFRLDGDYAWVAENCHKFGLINRYDESKQDITGIMDEPWHYRYVGIPHAYVMKNKNICLEEYIISLKYYSYNGNHLNVIVDDGTEYEIYYVNGTFSNSIPVPENYEYEVSGNNVDGYIVTVNMSAKTE